MMTVADADTIAVSEEEQADIDEKGGMAAHDVVVQVFESFVPNNVASALANDELLAVLVSAVVVGCLIRGPDSSLLRAVREIEKIVMKIIVRSSACVSDNLLIRLHRHSSSSWRPSEFSS